MFQLCRKKTGFQILVNRTDVLVSMQENDFWILIYHCDSFSSDDGQAIRYALSPGSQLQPLQYAEDELKNV
jgi:hypothetical protein